ncbi:MAG: hypothetical protein ABIH74_05605 [Candidatus Omnitrophota bacterium]
MKYSFSIKNLKIRLFTAGIRCLAAFFLYMCSVSPFLHAAGTGSPQKGMCYVTWDKDRFGSSDSDESMERLASAGVEYIAICITHFQRNHDSTVIERTDRTPSDKSVIHAIKKAREIGLTVMLKPHIDIIDKGDGTYWRADIGFTREEDWQEWFQEYRRFILHYARMAEEHDVSIFCVGTELTFSTQKTSEWRDIIKGIREVFSGELTYAANWDNFKNIKFWEDLDYAGIDAYFPLSYQSDPSEEELKKGWEKWKDEITIWHAEINKPVLFTEIGYPSAPNAPSTPWQNGSNGNADQEIQARCYKAFFETMWDQPWLAGVYWWAWKANIYAGGKHNRHFTPQNKSALQVLEANYMI